MTMSLDILIKNAFPSKLFKMRQLLDAILFHTLRRTQEVNLAGALMEFI